MPKPHYKVLIVDDNPDDRASYRRVLQRDPDTTYSIDEANLGSTGLAICQTAHPDCLLLDYRLLDIDGLQFLARLREQVGSQMPAVVMLTGTGDEIVAVGAMKHGAQDYLVKGALALENLQRTVTNAIEKVKLYRTLEAQHQQLRQSEARFRALVNAVPAFVWAAAPDGTMTLVSGQWEEYCGMTAEQLARDWPRLVLHPDDYERCMAQWSHALAQGTNYEVEVRNRRHDGEYRWFLTRAVPARDDTGRIIGWYGTTTDIHDRKQAEEALRQQAEIIDQTHDAVIATDLDGRITSWNKGADRLFGYTAAEIIGCSVLMLFPGDLRSHFPTMVMAPLQEHGQHELELRQRQKSGEENYVRLSLSLRRDPQGLPIGIIGYAIDVTARKQAEDAVRHMNEELQQFAYIVSHDLSEPLRTISNYLQLLARRYQGKLDTTADEFFGLAVDGSRRLQQMISDLLIYTRAGGQDLTFTPVDCEALLTRVLSDLQIAIKESSATIIHDHLPVVRGDATRLGQLLQNLISNALKFRGTAAPQIQISSQRVGPYWHFAIRDNGIGIDPAQTGRLFQVFQRLHTRSEYPGTGMGLAICKKILERHGGRIWVESTLGTGTTFWFTLLAGEDSPADALAQS